MEQAKRTPPQRRHSVAGNLYSQPSSAHSDFPQGHPPPLTRTRSTTEPDTTGSSSWGFLGFFKRRQSVGSGLFASSTNNTSFKKASTGDIDDIESLDTDSSSSFQSNSSSHSAPSHAATAPLKRVPSASYASNRPPRTASPSQYRSPTPPRQRASEDMDVRPGLSESDLFWLVLRDIGE